MKIKWKMSNGLVNCSRKGEIELSDEEASTMSDDDIEEVVREDMWNFTELSWYKE